MELPSQTKQSNHKLNTYKNYMGATLFTKNQEELLGFQQDHGAIIIGSVLLGI